MTTIPFAAEANELRSDNESSVMDIDYPIASNEQSSTGLVTITQQDLIYKSNYLPNPYAEPLKSIINESHARIVWKETEAVSDLANSNKVGARDINNNDAMIDQTTEYVVRVQTSYPLGHKVCLPRPLFELQRRGINTRYRLIGPSRDQLTILHQKVDKESYVAANIPIQETSDSTRSLPSKPLVMRSAHYELLTNDLPLMEQLQEWFKTTAYLFSAECFALYGNAEEGLTLWLEDGLALIDLCHLLDVTFKHERTGGKSSSQATKSHYNQLHHVTGSVAINVVEGLFHGSLLRYSNAFRAPPKSDSYTPGKWMYFNLDRTDLQPVGVAVDVYNKNATKMGAYSTRFDRDYALLRSSEEEAVQEDGFKSQFRVNLLAYSDSPLDTPPLLRIYIKGENFASDRSDDLRTVLYCVNFEYLMWKEENYPRCSVIDNRMLLLCTENSRSYEDSPIVGHDGYERKLRDKDVVLIRFTFVENCHSNDQLLEGIARNPHALNLSLITAEDVCKYTAKYGATLPILYRSSYASQISL